MKDNQEILTIDSTKKGQFNATVRKHARGMQLEGALCTFRINTEFADQFLLGRVGNVDTTNLVHENPSFGPLIMESGTISFFSKDADVEKTVIEEVACIDIENKKLTGRKANPSSGTPGYLANSTNVQLFINEPTYLAYIGHTPGFSDILLSIINKQFCRDINNLGDPSTWNQARHRILVGQNGSGKTTLAATILACNAVKHQKKGFLIPDTKGDFATENRFSDGNYIFDFHELLRKGHRDFKIINFPDLRMESTTTFRYLLEKRLLIKMFRTISENASRLADYVVDGITRDKRIDIRKHDLSFQHILQLIQENVTFAWAKTGAKEKQVEIDRLIETGLAEEKYKERYEREILSVFLGKYHLREIAARVLQDGDFIILNIEPKSVTKEMQELVMSELFKAVKAKSKELANNTKSANAEIVLDEAHRWIPQKEQDNAAIVVKDAVKTTRAYSVGWTFITQSLTSIDKDLLRECHTKWFARGLGIGADRNHMQSVLGDRGMFLYDHLQNIGGIFYVGIGHEINLGNGNMPLAVMGIGGNATDEIIRINPQIWGNQETAW